MSELNISNQYKLSLNKGETFFYFFFNKTDDFRGFSPELQRGVNGLSVSRCMTILPAYYSGGCWCEYTCMKEEPRLTLDS